MTATPLFVGVEPAEVTPGRPGVIRLTITNGTDGWRGYVVRPVGFDEEWAPGSMVVDPVGPGESTTVEIPLTMPAGYPACEYRALVTVQPTILGDGKAAEAAVSADILVVVGDVSRIFASLEPADLQGRDRAKFAVVLCNRGATPVTVGLDATAPPAMSVRFAQSAAMLPPGREVRVKARVHYQRRAATKEGRLPFVVRVQGHTTPIQLDGTFRTRPLIGPVMSKIGLGLFVLAAWAVLLLLGLSFVANRVTKPRTATVTGASATATTVPGEASASSAGASSGGASSSSGGGSSSDAAGGGAAATGGSSGGGGTAAEPGTVKVSGQVASKAPQGITVTIEPASLVDEESQGATVAGGSSERNTPIGKLQGQLIALSAPKVVSDARSTTTAADGSWGFGGIRAPGFYLLTFSKAGFETRKYVVTAGEDGKPVELKASLDAGDGALSGTVRGPNGPLGNVELTVSDGTVSFTTRAPTKGDVGNWSISGLSTPSTYLVTATLRGYATETLLVDLGAGKSVKGADITMKPGVAAVTGKITSAEGPVGGVDVTVTDGTNTRTASTITVGPVGSFTLPALPVPATYTLRVSGAGWTTETRRLDLTGNAVIDTVLTRTTADITGLVSDAAGSGIAGAGVTLSNDEVTLKTTTVSNPAGSYTLTAVPPGTYVVAFERFGKQTQTTPITVGPGDVRTLDIVLPNAEAAGVTDTAIIRGHVIELRSGAVLAGNCEDLNGATVDCSVRVTADGGAPIAVNNAGDYEIGGLGPGVHHLQVTAVGHEPAAVTVSVAAGGIAFAPTAQLAKLSQVSGIILSNAGGPVIDAQVDVRTTGANPTVVATAPTDNAGRYIVRGLTHGHYELAFGPKPGVPGFEHVPASSILDLNPGDAVTVDSRLDRLGRIHVDTQTTDARGAVVARAGVKVTATNQAGAAVASLITGDPASNDPDNTVTFTALPGGTYTLKFEDCALPTVNQPCTPLGAAAAQIIVSKNITSEYLATMLRSPEMTTGRVVWLLNGVDVPVAGANVSVTGTTGFDTIPNPVPHLQPRRQTVTAITGADGRFAFTQDDPALPHSPAIPGGQASKQAKFVVDVADFTVTGSAFQTLSQPSVTIFTDLTFRLTPKPVGVTGQVQLVGAAPGESPSDVSVTVAQAPPGIDGVKVRVDPSGVIVWSDPGTAVGGATSNLGRPGAYQLEFTRPFYDPVSVAFTIQLGAASRVVGCPVPNCPVSLFRHGSITARSFTGLFVPINGAVFTLSQGGRTIASATATPNSNQVTFSDLSTTTGAYSIAAIAAGFDPPNPPAPPITPPAGGNALQDLRLSQLASMSGRLVGVAGPVTTPLAGVEITAAANGGGASGTFTTVTRGDGTFVITGTVDNRGLVAGTYTLTASVNGYQPLSVSRTVVGGQALLTGDLLLTANNISVQGHITDSSNQAALAGVSLVVFDTALRLQAPKPGDVFPPDATGLFKITLAPGQYVFVFSLANYSPLSLTVTLQPGVQPADLDVSLQSRFNTIKGFTKARFGTTVEDLTGVRVTLLRVNLDLTTTEVAHDDTATAAGGAAFTLDKVPDGGYTMTFHKAGFVDQSTNIIIGGAQVLSAGVFTLQAKTPNLPVRVLSSIGGSALPNATVALTSTGGHGVSQSGVPVTDGAGNTTFLQVVPGNYTLTATVAGHPDGSASVQIDPTDAAALTRVDVTIHEARITGHVERQDSSNPGGVAAANFTYSLSPAAASAGALTTNGTGDLSILVPSSNASYALTFTTDGNYTTQTVNVPITDGQTTGAGTVTIQRKATLALVITDANDAAVTDATITVTPDGSSKSAADPDGSYRFPPVYLPGDVVSVKVDGKSNNTETFDVTIGLGPESNHSHKLAFVNA